VTVFVALSALLAALVVALLAWPLLRARGAAPGATQSEASAAVLRDQLAELERDFAAGAIGAAAFEAAKHELQHRVLEDTVPERAAGDRRSIATVVAVAVFVPAVAAALYAVVGTPEALSPQAAAPPHPDMARIEGMVAKLAQRLKEKPDDPEGWMMLARSYRVLDRHAEAVTAFERAGQKVATDPARLVDWAESLALSQGGVLAGKPTELLDRALAIDPDFATALALAGSAAFERADWKMAVAHWERLGKQFPAGTEQAELIAKRVAEAKLQLERAAAKKPAAK